MLLERNINNLQEVTEQVCDLKGSVVALEALLSAILAELPPSRLAAVNAAYTTHIEIARTVLLNMPISEHTVGSFERDATRFAKLIAADRG